MVRCRNRYIVAQIVPLQPSETLQFSDYKLLKCLLGYVGKFYGDYGVGILDQGFRIKYCNKRTKIIIIRCSHHSYRYVTSILPLITLIDDVQAKFRTLYTGATIMQCNKFITKHHLQFFDHLLGKTSSAKERSDLLKLALEFDLEK